MDRGHTNVIKRSKLTSRFHLTNSEILTDGLVLLVSIYRKIIFLYGHHRSYMQIH